MDAVSAFAPCLTEARNLFFKAHQPEASWAALQPELESLERLSEAEKLAGYQLAGLILKSLGRYQEAYDSYRMVQDDYQAGYCKMLLGQLDLSRLHWAKVVVGRKNHWCLTLFGMLTQQMTVYPTLLQIRNNLEGDIHSLLTAKQMGYIAKIQQYLDFLSQINLETPKFFGRAYLNCGYPDEARRYLKIAQQTLINDPETYYFLGEYYAQYGTESQALSMLNQCLLISPTYTPARDLKRALSQ
jgi:tetratricopeptide (TPR) repeat protein